MIRNLRERRKTNRRTSLTDPLFPLQDRKTYFRIVFMVKQTDFLQPFINCKIDHKQHDQ